MKLDKATLNDTERVKNYISTCPYVGPDSEIIAAALSGIEQHILGNEDGDNSDCCSSSTTSSVSHEHDRCNASEVPFKESFSPKKKGKSRLPVTALRSIILDIPLMLLFATYIGILWVHRVHDLYLKPLHDAMDWTDERQDNEMTYYARTCDANDLTTKNGLDLFLEENATAKDAYEHQLHHGFTVFPRVLSEETATALRNHVVERNNQLKPSESIFVIANEKRYSLALGIEEPVVANAMMELATNELFSQALEEVLGPSPSMIEMSTITSTYGAENQYFHGDVVERASPLKFGRAFGPSYSVFIQLQNTTKAMGSTAVCPGTHMCATADVNQKLCNEEGFQLVNEDGHWRQGDAVLMNMNSYHRGAAHTDPDGLDRVLLVMTFAPKPKARAESRLLSQGITFSLRWDMWGHTLRDLANAKTAMRWPLTIFRALGLYKPKNTEWGIDYVTGSLMRISNEDHGFRRGHLDTFIERDGGFWWLPKFLHGEFSEDESWYEFLLDTLKRCEKFAGLVNKVAVLGYLSLHLHYLVLSWFWGVKTERSRKGRFAWALFRLAVTHGMIYLAFLFANRHVDQTGWAVDIRGGRMYSPPYGNWENEYDGPTTLPWRADVLIETRYASDYLALYNDFVGKNHPGNRKWNSFLSDGAQAYALYGGLPIKFRTEMAEFIVGSIENEQGRFLYQRSDGAWVVMSYDDAVKHTRKELQIKSNPIRSRLMTEMGFLISECKFGKLRNTALSKKFSFPLLKGLKHQLATDKPTTETIVRHVRVEAGSFPLKHTGVAPFHRTFQMPVPKKMMMESNEVDRGSLHVGDIPNEPYSGAWLMEGDDIEGIYEINGKIYSYRGVVENVTSTGMYYVVHSDGDREKRNRNWIRRFEPYYENEAVEVWHNKEWQVCRIRSIRDDDLYSVMLLDDNDTVLDEIYDGRIRRRHRKHPVDDLWML